MATLIIGDNTTGGSGTNTTGLEDCFINVQSPTVNNNGIELSLREGATQIRRALVRPTDAALASLSGATINSAFFRFYVTSSSAGRIWTAYECLRAWGEATATWNTYDGTNSWATAGGTGTGDIDSTSNGTGTTVSSGTFDLTLDAAGIAALQDMVNAGTGNGWLIQTNFDSSQIVHSSEGTDGSRVELVIDYSEAGSSVTKSPTTGLVTISGQQPSVNPFSSVHIREVLINEAGSPLASMTGMKLVIWYGAVPSGAPDLSYSAVTTGANGTLSYSIATGSLIYNQAIFYVATDGSASLSAWTCARMIPTYLV